jgi:hypothetical protein
VVRKELLIEVSSALKNLVWGLVWPSPRLGPAPEIGAARDRADRRRRRRAGNPPAAPWKGDSK